MEKKIIRHSVAATILITGSLVLLGPFDFPGGPHGVVWADAAAKVTEARALVHQEKRFFYEQGQDEPFMEANVMKYVSSERGIVEEQYDIQGTLVYRLYLLKQSRRALLIFPTYKRYLDLPLDETFSNMIDSITPKGLADWFASLAATPRGRSQFDGHEVEGFDVNDVSIFPIPERYRFLAPLERLHYTLWIDVDSSLPVGAEAEMTSGPGLLTLFKKLRVKARAFDLRWDAEIPEGTFEPKIPEDCVPIDVESLAKENAAWLGVGAIPVIGVAVYGRRRRSHPARPAR